MDRAREHFSLVYHRYLSGESGIAKLQITINGELVQLSDTFLKNKSIRPMDDEVLLIKGQKVIVRPYILPHISRMSRKEIKQLGGEEGLRKRQEFYIYWNKRLLIGGTWFRMMRQRDLSKLSHIQVDIPNTLDEAWALDIKKSSAAHNGCYPYPHLLCGKRLDPSLYQSRSLFSLIQRLGNYEGSY